MLGIIIVTNSYCYIVYCVGYVYVFLLLRILIVILCNIIFMFMYSYCYVRSVLCILFHSVVLCIVCV